MRYELLKMIGKEFDRDEIICCFDDTEKKIYVNASSNNGYDYVVYEEDNDEQFLFKVDTNDIITDVWSVGK